MEITLLSVEEYEALREHIPTLNCWWWLRSPGFSQDGAAGVYRDGSVYYFGYRVYNVFGAVRPALKSNWIFKDEKIGSKIDVYGNTWTVISDELALSDYIIDFRSFDEKSNKYEESEIKQYLEKWLDEKECETLYD